MAKSKTGNLFAMSFSSLINISDIIKNHFKSIKNDNTGHAEGAEWLTFCVYPMIVSCILLLCGIFISNQFVGNLVSGLAIFIGLMLNALVILYDIIQKLNQSERKILVTVSKEILANISFSILLSIVCILALFSTTIEGYPLVTYTTNFISYFLLFQFLLTLLMVIKRVYRLYEHEIERRINE